MDTGKFDSLAKALSESSSRRSALKGVAGGGVAALFALLGLRGAEAGDVAAERRRRRRRRRPAVDTCVIQVGVPLNATGQANGSACTGGNPAACQSGFCPPIGAVACAPCPVVCLTTGGINQCCPGSTTCIDGACKTCTEAPKKRRRRRRRK